MSEVGMALSNPYRPVEDRTVACVGLPLPSTAARVASASDLKPLVTVEADAANVEVRFYYFIEFYIYTFQKITPKKYCFQVFEVKLL